MAVQAGLPKGVYELPTKGGPESYDHALPVARLPRVKKEYDPREVTQSNVTDLLDTFCSDSADTAYLQEQSDRLRNTQDTIDSLVSVIQDEVDALGQEWQNRDTGNRGALMRRGQAIDALLAQLDLVLVRNAVDADDGNDIRQGILARLHSMFGVARGSVTSNIEHALEVRPRNVAVGVVATCAIAGTVVPSAAASENTMATGAQAVHTNFEAYSHKGNYTKIFDIIAQGEGTGDNYDARFGDGGSHSPDLTSMTVAQVRQYQNDMIAGGARSNAIGRWQIMGTTLDSLMRSDGVNYSTKFSPQLQDQFAIDLMKKRGLNQYLAGQISDKQFAHNLAMEWASLPTVIGSNPGASYYGGDGLNHSAISVSSLLSAVDAIKSPAPSHHTAPKRKSKPKPKLSLKSALGAPVGVGSDSTVLNILPVSDTSDTEPVANHDTPDSTPDAHDTTPKAAAPTTTPEPKPKETTPPPSQPTPKTTTPPKQETNPSSGSDPNVLTTPASGIFESIQKVPSGGTGHDVYYSNQIMDLLKSGDTKKYLDKNVKGVDGINRFAACSLESAAMVISSLEHNPNISISKLHQGALDSGSYSDVTGAQYPYNGKWMNYLHDSYGLSTQTILDQNQHEPVTADVLSQVDDALAEGKILIVHTSKYSVYRDKRPTSAGHLFVMYAKADGKYYVANPANRDDNNSGFTAQEIEDWADGFYAFSDPGYDGGASDTTPASASTSSSSSSLDSLLQNPVASTAPSKPSTPAPSTTAESQSQDQADTDDDSTSPATPAPEHIMQDIPTIDSKQAEEKARNDSQTASLDVLLSSPITGGGVTEWQKTIIAPTPKSSDTPAAPKPSPSSTESEPTPEAPTSSASSKTDTHDATQTPDSTATPDTKTSAPTPETTTPPSDTTTAASPETSSDSDIKADSDVEADTPSIDTLLKAPIADTKADVKENVTPSTQTPPTAHTKPSAPTSTKTHESKPKKSTSKSAEKSKTPSSAMTAEKAKAVCSEAGATYVGPATGYVEKVPHSIYICNLPSSMGSFPVNVEIASKVVAAVNELRSKGVSISVISGFRSEKSQLSLRYQYSCDEPNGPSSAGCTHPVAVPGTSNHQMGLAVDISSPSGYYGIVRQVFQKHGLTNYVPNDPNHFSVPNGY